MGAPWFKLYASDLLADSKVRLLTDDQLGKLVKLWCFACQDGSIPADLAIATRLLGVATKNELAWVSDFFAPDPADPSRLVSSRMLREKEGYDKKCERLRSSASLGGKKKQINRLAEARILLEKKVANGVAKRTEPEPEPEYIKICAPTRKPKPKKETKPKEPTLQDVLGELATALPEDEGGGWTLERAQKAFWKILGNWNQDKFPAPKKVAEALLAAVRKGASIQAVYFGACDYVKTVDDKRFMTRPLEWIQNEGWLSFQEIE